MDIFCQEKLLKHEHITEYLEKIDSDKNGNIESTEFFEDFIENLEVKKTQGGAPVTLKDIEKYIKDNYGEKYPDFGQG